MQDTTLGKVYIVAVLLIAILVSFYCQYPMLKDKYIIADDIRQNIFWMAKFQDSELFPDDIFLRYTSWMNPIGVKTVHYLSSFFGDAIIIAKTLSLFQCAIAALYIFFLGRLLRNNRTGFLLAVLFVLVAWHRELIFFEDAAAGSFFPILLVAFLYYFVKKDHLKCAITLIIQSIFYPVAPLICLFTYGISFIRYQKRGLSFEINREKLIYFFIAAIICFSIIAPRYLSQTNEFGKIITLKQMRNMPEFYSDGRIPFFYSNLYRRLTNERSGIGLTSSAIFLAVISLVLLAILRKRALEFPKELWCFMLSSCLLFILASIVALRLFAPSRYLRITLPIFLVIFTTINIDRLTATLKKAVYRKILIAVFIAVIFIFYLPRIQGRIEHRAPDLELYEFLSTLPKDILIAGHPRNMDDIPTFAKRKVLIMEELSLPYHPKFYNEVKERTFDFFDAYYATVPKDIYAFCLKYGVTHFVVYPSHFTNDCLRDGIYRLPPFHDYIINLVRSRDKDKFILNNIPDSKKLLVSNDYFVIECDKRTLLGR